MANKTHYLHMYNRHKAQATEGRRFWRKFATANYKHRIHSQGWYDTMTCDIEMTLPQLMQAIDPANGDIMREVAVFVDNPVKPIWEGLISRITAELPNGQLTIGIDGFANEWSVQYTSSAGATTATTLYSDADSIARYGSKIHFYDIGDNHAGAAAGLPDHLASRFATDLTFPQVSFIRGSGGAFKVTIEAVGVYHTLAWEIGYVSDVTTNLAWGIVTVFMHTGWGVDYTGRNSSTNSSEGVGIFYYDDYNGGTPLYFDQTPAWSQTYEKINGMSIWEKVLAIAEAGENDIRYIVGIRPRDINDQNRARPYFLPESTEVKYVTNAVGDGIIRNPRGGEIPPWLVTPDAIVRITDILFGYDAGNWDTDQREQYISAIEYDAEANDGAGDITWINEDNITLDGVFQQNQAGGYITKRNTKSHSGRRFN